MYRFYYPDIKLENRIIHIRDKQELHHMIDVLRLKEGDNLSVFNGRGVEAYGYIAEVNEGDVVVYVTEIRRQKIRLPYVVIASAIPKRGKFETIIEKVTELGVSEIIPLYTQRSEVIYTEDKLLRKMKRFSTVAVNAAKQSKRDVVPEIHHPMSFREAVVYLKEKGIVIIPSLINERKNLLGVLNEHKNQHFISFLIGPEGDFTNEEYMFAFENNVLPVGLGENILKVETAAITVAACTHLYFSPAYYKEPLIL